MFITAVCVLFLIKLRWPKNKRDVLVICTSHFHSLSCEELWFQRGGRDQSRFVPVRLVSQELGECTFGVSCPHRVWLDQFIGRDWKKDRLGCTQAQCCPPKCLAACGSKGTVEWENSSQSGSLCLRPLSYIEDHGHSRIKIEIRFKVLYKLCSP